MNKESRTGALLWKLSHVSLSHVGHLKITRPVGFQSSLTDFPSLLQHNQLVVGGRWNEKLILGKLRFKKKQNKTKIRQRWGPFPKHPAPSYQNQSWFQFCPLSLLSVLSEQQYQDSQCFCGPSEEDQVHFERFWIDRVTEYPCGRGSCRTPWPGGPSPGRAQAWCVWSRGRTHPVHRPCSGAWTWLEWTSWSTGGTGWYPGLVPSSQAGPPPSQNLEWVGLGTESKYKSRVFIGDHAQFLLDDKQTIKLQILCTQAGANPSGGQASLMFMVRFQH